MIKGLRNILKRSKALVIQIIIILCCVIFSYVVYVNGQTINFTLDFEEGNLRGWERTGNAFQYQPTLGDNPTARNRGQPSQHQGRYWIGTYEKYHGHSDQRPGDIQGDRPQGTLTSAPFTIPRGKLSFLIGGGSSFQTRVELLVQDPIEGSMRVFQASGRNTETMHRVEWNLTPYAGKTGRIRIVDASSEGWGHINADDFRFTAVQGVTTPVIPAFPLEQKVEVPDLVRRTISEAENILNRVKLRLGEITKKPSNQKEGTILRQSPVAHSKVEKGTPIHIWVAERELIEVPNLVRHHIDEAERILREFRLQLGDITKRASDKKEGTILRQEPSAGTRVPVGSHVNLWIPSKREKPVAKINPAHLRVTQGEKAVFESQSAPESEIKESWRGPGGQRAKGRYFEVHTDKLGQGSYDIILNIIDKYEQQDKAVATLEVIHSAVKPIARISPERIEVVQGESVIFSSLSAPESRVRERWTGPGDQKGTGRQFRVDTSHLDPGNYEIVLEVSDDHHQRDRAVATLRVNPRPTPPQISVYLKADKELLWADERVMFEATIRPPYQDAEYQFNFGDGRQSDWVRSPEIAHIYEIEGTYHAVVKARIERGRVVISNSVTIAVKRPSKPAAKINPSILKVVQGGKAVFESQATPEGIRERWTGPGGQGGAGRSFEVRTDQLNPGHYDIVLEIRDRWGQTDRAMATLEVIPKPIVKYNVTIQADPTSIEEGKSVRFEAALHPQIQNIQYRFNFGDQWSDWTVESELQHTYSSPGIYHAFVRVRKEGKIIAESRPVDIEIYRVHLPPGDRARRESVPGTDGRPGIPPWLKWAGIIAGLGAVFGAGYYLSTKVHKQKKEKHLEPSIHIRPYKDIGTQQIESGTPVLSGFEICLRPVLDKGKQDIEANGSLIDERREHG